jgi:hypothetical protein
VLFGHCFFRVIPSLKKLGNLKLPLSGRQGLGGFQPKLRDLHCRKVWQMRDRVDYGVG